MPTATQTNFKFQILSHKPTMETNVSKHQACTECDYTCVSKLQLTKHLKTHSKKRPVPQFNCDECGLTFDSGRKLKNHEKKLHLEEQPRFTCDDCGQKFNTSRKLKNHSAKFHKSDESKHSEDNSPVRKIMKKDGEQKEDGEAKQEEKEDEALRKNLQTLRDDSIKEDQMVLDELLNKGELDKVEKLNKLLTEKDQQIKSITADHLAKELKLKQQVGELNQAKVILTNHSAKLKEEINVKTRVIEDLKEELVKRKDNQVEWQDYATKYKIKSKILEVNVKKLERSVSTTTTTEEENNSMESNEPDMMREESIPKEDILHTEDITDRTCETCKTSFVSIRVLQEHKVVAHIKNFKCKDCDFEVDTEEEIREHIKIHEEIREPNFSCTPCGLSFARETLFRQHMTETHAHEDKFNCQQCDFQTNCGKLLENHKTLTGHDQSSEEVTCKTCKKTFRNMEKLRDHRREEHPSTLRCKYYNNPKCTFGTKCLYVHVDEMDVEGIEVELGEKCKSCDKKFQSKNEVMKHRKVEHPMTVSECRDFKQARCLRNECWFRHEEVRETSPQEKQDFPKEVPQHKPPEHSQVEQDNQKVIINMMEAMMVMMRSWKQ